MNVGQAPRQKKPIHDLLDGATAEERKKYPLYSGGMAYFRDAWLRIAKVSYEGNKQHNGPDHPLQWTRGKSSDHKDCVARHLATGDEEEHLASMAWRACADLQMFLEQKYNIKPPPGCKMNPPPKSRPGYYKGSGSPGEWMVERMGELDTELRRRSANSVS